MRKYTALGLFATQLIVYIKHTRINEYITQYIDNQWIRDILYFGECLLCSYSKSYFWAKKWRIIPKV